MNRSQGSYAVPGGVRDARAFPRREGWAENVWLGEGRVCHHSESRWSDTKTWINSHADVSSRERER